VVDPQCALSQEQQPELGAGGLGVGGMGGVGVGPGAGPEHFAGSGPCFTVPMTRTFEIANLDVASWSLLPVGHESCAGAQPNHCEDSITAPMLLMVFTTTSLDAPAGNGLYLLFGTPSMETVIVPSCANSALMWNFFPDRVAPDPQPHRSQFLLLGFPRWQRCEWWWPLHNYHLPQ